MTNQDHIWHILDDVLLLLAGQHYPTPERTYKLDGGWSLALADLKRCFADLRAKLALVEAERDAARAGEARAVECLKEIDEYNGGADSVLEDEYVTHRRMEVMDGASSLAWLARQRREAVAAWIEKEATKCRQQNGEYYDRGVDCMLREAAALRAGEVGND